jgi:sortase A
MSAVATAPQAAARQHTAGDFLRAGVRGVGQLLITVGVVILLFVAYELWWTNLQTNADQHRLTVHLHQLWSRPANQIPPISAVPLGGGIAVLYIPRFGKDYHPVIVQGTGYDQLVEGPGHWVGSAYPGQIGNFYVAGHRTTHSAPFNRLAELRRGDDIYVETAKAWFTYRLEDIPGDPAAHWQEIVQPDDISISYPVPDQPDPTKRPTQRLLTFSTCNPEYSASQRLVVHGLLVGRHARTPGYRPPAVVNG